MYKLVDSHSHLNDGQFDNDRDETVKQICSSGVGIFITAGYSLDGSKKAVEIAKKYGDCTIATVGISPNDIPQSEEELWKELAEIEELVKKDIAEKSVNPNSENILEKFGRKICAIGEIGLDYHWNSDNKELQKLAFIEQIKLANKYNLPIFIHTRDAVMDTLQILKEHKVNNVGAFHCCPQNRELIKQGLKLGFYISFAGPITFKSSKNAVELINLVPNDRILTETDSPYLAPEPVRGTRNTPANVKFVAQKIADAKNISLEEVEKCVWNNLKRLLHM